MIKKILFISILLFPLFASAQESSPTTAAPSSLIFKAEVTRVVEERTVDLDGVNSIVQQNLQLKGLEGEFKDKSLVFNGIGNIEVVSNQKYRAGDKVMMIASKNSEGETSFYVTDYVRTNALWWVFALFIISLIAVGRAKGLRSIIALALTFLIIIKFIIPWIMSGSDPLFITIIGSFVILAIIIYLTEGLKTEAHLSILSISLSLIITVILSTFFVKFAKLTGASSEDILFIFDLKDASVNLQGLLLAGIIIGVLGVLDDVVISQVAAVKQLSIANPQQSFKELFGKGYDIGISHITSMTNTLFLAYAGASLPLLILFVSGNTNFSGPEQVFNTEFISAEIIRTLSGSIGLILSVPIATAIAAWKYSGKNS